VLLIPCPHCGPSAQTEFTYGGDAGVNRPEDPWRVSDADWHAYLHLRANPRGSHDERWYHSLGCRRWIVLHRDVSTHAIAGIGLPGEAR